MRRAIELSRRGFPAPNPHVGCVLVRKGVIVGEGFHAYAGGPHAEALALLKAGAKANGATAYVTLEPCSHIGRTPPCAEVLVAAGISRVVAATQDPCSKVNGAGFRYLKKGGVEVLVGVLRQEAEDANSAFLKFQRTGLPWVTVKAAMSMDGKIATRSGDSKWITDEAARKYAHKLRADHAAVVIGIGTVVADDPLLIARIPGAKNQPIRVVVDEKLQSPFESRIFGQEARTVVFHKTGRGRHPHVEYVRVQSVGPAVILAELAKMEVSSVLVEGGGETIGSFADDKFVDSVAFFYAPILIGGREAKTAVEGLGVASVAQALHVVAPKIKRIGAQWLVEGRCSQD